MMKRQRLYLPLYLLLASLGMLPDVQAQTADAQLKAALLYRFAQYSEWAPPPPSQLHYCVAGDDTVYQALQLMLPKGKAQVRQLSKASQARDCTVLYLSADLAKLADWSALLRQTGCLTVVEGADLFRKGAIFGLIVEPKRISFRVNLTVAREQGFHLSAQMLKLAKEIH
ncbi:MAG: YfiR family protein [Rheinheimera sp.]